MTDVRPHCDVCDGAGVSVSFAAYPGDEEATMFWQCTQCENRWHIHPKGTWEYEVADSYVQRGKDRAREH